MWFQRLGLFSQNSCLLFWLGQFNCLWPFSNSGLGSICQKKWPTKKKKNHTVCSFQHSTGSWNQQSRQWELNGLTLESRNHWWKHNEQLEAASSWTRSSASHMAKFNSSLKRPSGLQTTKCTGTHASMFKAWLSHNPWKTSSWPERWLPLESLLNKRSLHLPFNMKSSRDWVLLNLL